MPAATSLPRTPVPSAPTGTRTVTVSVSLSHIQIPTWPRRLSRADDQVGMTENGRRISLIGTSLSSYFNDSNRAIDVGDLIRRKVDDPFGAVGEIGGQPRCENVVDLRHVNLS